MTPETPEMNPAFLWGFLAGALYIVAIWLAHAILGRRHDDPARRLTDALPEGYVTTAGALAVMDAALTFGTVGGLIVGAGLTSVVAWLW